ncbi:organic anion transporter 3 [Octopus bimaculoides]|uniref:organic anion transporter 3 n=1 Tax=Octopus bimaculoides TaxID=37653 RepID=UPI0022E0F5A3|nr:organic anion transporter 3 [Octopus bimaculoides]
MKAGVMVERPLVENRKNAQQTVENAILDKDLVKEVSVYKQEYVICLQKVVDDLMEDVGKATRSEADDVKSLLNVNIVKLNEKVRFLEMERSDREVNMERCLKIKEMLSHKCKDSRQIFVEETKSFKGIAEEPTQCLTEALKSKDAIVRKLDKWEHLQERFIPGSECAPLNTSQLQEYGYHSNETHEIVYEACQININSLDGSSKNETLECINGYSYDRDKYSSFVSEILIAMFRIAKGRKPILVLSGILTLIVSVGSSFSPNYVVFAVLRGLEGIFIQGLSVSCITIMLEHFPVSSKTLMCGVTGIVWSLSVVPFGPIAYLLRHYNWRINNIVFSATHAVVFFQFWFLEESLRWVVTNGFVERSKKIIKRASKYNGVDFDRIWGNNMKSSLIPLVSSENKKKTPSKEDLNQQDKVKEGFHTIFKDSLARKISIIVLFIGLTNTLTYYGIYLTSSELAGDHYLNFFLVSLTELAANILMAVLLFKLQRRSTMALFLCLSGVSLLCAVLVNNLGGKKKVFSIINTVFSMMGMFGISASNCIMWLYTPEVYPTNLRNIGLGFLAFCDSIGSMISPYFRILMLYVPWLPGTIFAIGTLTSVCLLNFMPETQRLQMPTTMDDVRKQLEAQKRKKKNPSSEENYQDSNLTQA